MDGVRKALNNRVDLRVGKNDCACHKVEWRVFVNKGRLAWNLIQMEDPGVDCGGLL